MSFTEILEELPRLSPEERQAVSRLIKDIQSVQPQSEWRDELVDGKRRLVAPRVIRQAEVEAILADFP